MHKWLLSLTSALILSLGLLGLFATATVSPVQAAEVERTPISPTKLKKDITTFFSAGAEGYLLWQFCGTEGGPRGHRTLCDDFGFFSNSPEWPEVCGVLKEAANNNQGKFVGVNMWDLGEMESPQIINQNLSDLNTKCGVTVVRIFALNDVGKVSKAIEGARGTNVKLIIALGDWVNGGVGISPAAPGIDWFQSGYKGAYQNYALDVSKLAGQNKDLIYGLELANEPHCKGDASQGALDAYKGWADDMASKVKSVSGITNIGIGQMASQNTTKCDSPEGNHFNYTNSGPNITMVSGHNYSDQEIQVNLDALSQTPAGKTFYIGEAGGGGGATEAIDPYYLYPIRGLTQEALETSTSPTETAKEIWTDMINQGYGVMCAAPKIAVKNNSGPFDQYLMDNFFGPDTVIGVESELIADYSSAKVPLYRDPSRQNDENKFRADIESFFGYQDLTAKDPQTQLLYSGALYTLLDAQQQCQYKVQLLESMEAMCQKLPAEQQANCALYHEKVPYTKADYTMKSLYDDWRTSNLTCAQLVRKRAPAGFDRDRFTRLQAGINNAPIFLNKAYRLAFVVLSATYHDPPEEAKAIFNFLRSGVKPNPHPKNDVRVIALKVPDFAMNRYVIENAANPESVYQDPLQISGHTQLSEAEINENAKAAKKQRQNLLNKEPEPVNINGIDKLIIECNEGEAPCDKPLVQALVTIVNKSGQTCEVNSEEPKYEKSEKIGDSTNLGDHTTGKLVEGQDAGTNANKPAPFSFFSEIRPGGNSSSNQDAPRIYTYLIIPQGENADELEFAQNALASLVYPDNMVKNFKNDPNLLSYFKFTGVKQLFNGNESIQTYPGEIPRDCLTDEQGVTRCERKVTFDVTTDPEDDMEPRILGAKLGALLQDIQKVLRPDKAPDWRFVNRCKTTEEFLLAQCGAQPVASQPVPEATCSISGGLIKDPTNQARWIGGEMIKSQALKNLIAAAAKKYNTPVQALMTTLWLENCRGAASICDMTDQQILEYSKPGAEFAGNCPGGGGGGQPFTGRSKGPFQFYHNLCLDKNDSGACEAGEQLVDWGFWRETSDGNVCNIKDSTYAAARYLSQTVSFSQGKGYVNYKPANEWTIDEAKQAVSLWAYNVKDCEANEFTQEYCKIIDRMWEGDGKVTTTCN